MNISIPDSMKHTTTYESGVAQATAYRVVKKITAQALKKYDLTCMQWFTIGMVLTTGSKGIRLTDLAHRLDTTLAYATNTVNFLESRKILTRTAHGTDGRIKNINIVPSYIATCDDIEKEVRDTLRHLLYANITPDELHTYIRVLYKISNLK